MFGSKTKLVVAAAALAVASCAPVSPPAAPVAKLMTWDDFEALPQPSAPDASFRYGDDPYQVVDLWRPAGRGPHPVVLMVHGGCWTTAIADRTIMNRAAAELRARGIAVWNIDYRGVDRKGAELSGIFNDVGAATDLLRDHAASQNLNVANIVAVGHSAGGHLALWTAARPRLRTLLLPRPSRPLPIAHVVSLGGLPDLEQAYREKQGCGRAPIVGLLTPSSVFAEQLDRADVLRNLSADKSIPLLAPIGVPQSLINGDADKIIPTRFAHDYAAKMRAKGDQVTVRIMAGQGHVELIAPGTPAWAATVEAIERALGRKPTG